MIAIATYFLMGSARGVGGVAMNTSLMEMVPKHLMGRVQNAFYFRGNIPATRRSPSAWEQSRTKSAWWPRSPSWPASTALSFVAASWPVGSVAPIEEGAAILAALFAARMGI